MNARVDYLGLEQHLLSHSAARHAAPLRPVGEAVSLIRGTDIQVQSVRWLWEGFLACGKLTLLAGSPGCGKTTAAIKIAATLSTGGRWPCGGRLEAPRDVVVWSGEDDPSDTLLPRFLASGGDPKRIHFVGDVKQGRGHRSFDPAIDMPKLQHALSEINPAMLIVDPIVSAIAGDSHKGAEVRRGLQPLVDACAALDCAVLGITHLSKGTAGRDPTERVTGSIAFAALARIVILCARAEAKDGEESKRVFVRSKSNIGCDAGGFAYQVRSEYVPGHAGLFASVAVWGAAVNTTAREALGEADHATDDEGASAQAEALEFLRAELADGEPKPTAELQKIAIANGIAWRTLRRAQKMLHIRPTKVGVKWCWVLPVAARFNAGAGIQLGQDGHTLKLGQVGQVEIEREEIIL
jgi:putative DNA primase/helicase